MNEFDKEKLIEKDIKSIENRVRHAFNQGYEAGLKHGKEQEPKWDRLYSWLNDMRLGIAPDETVTDVDERNERMAQADLLDEIMEWIEKAVWEKKSEDKE